MTDILGSDARLYWKGRAEEYDRNRGIIKTQKFLTERGIDLLKPGKGLILDVGCGTGISTKIIEDRNLPVVGLDISEDMLRLAKRKGLRVLAGDFRSLPFKGNSFHSIFSISTLQWITGRDEREIRVKYRETAEEFYRVIVKGGRALIQFFPATEGEMEMATEEFRKAGFTGYLVEDTDGRKYILLTKTGKEAKNDNDKEVF
ncbi:MAG: class I SAM-dependent methyltransferase [archaeon]|nr:MAG: class I SAM-dependent methyltransferase [archaeon]